MALQIVDRVRDTSTTTGTGSLTVSGAPPTDYQTFGSVMSTNDTCWYSIGNQGANEWEVGLGTYNGSNVLARTTVLSSSNSGSLVNFSAGTKDVFMTMPASILSALYTRATTAQAQAGTDTSAPMTAAATLQGELAHNLSNYAFLA